MLQIKYQTSKEIKNDKRMLKAIKKLKAVGEAKFRVVLGVRT